jgi:hypothetical protein
MKWRVTWSADAAVPSRRAVLRSQGLPDGPELPPRLAAVFEEAFALYRRLAEPRAILRMVGREEFATVYRGEGRNDAATPLALVYPRAEALVLFAATVGGTVTRAVADLFARHELAVGYALDAVASEAADRLAAAAAADCQGRLIAAGRLGPGARALPYSPGYCGWHVSGQRALFAVLRPEEIGITLNDSCLMQPLKSVSGVIVAGPGTIHQFDQTFPCCESCGTRHCQDRMLSVLDGSAPGLGLP